MIILTLRTDKPEAEIGLYRDQTQISYEVWEAHRRLAETLHTRIGRLLRQQQLDFKDVEGIVVYQGPGSFTGLRIGIAVANALAYSLDVPIIAAGDDWIERGIAMLLSGRNQTIAMPEYGQPAHTTTQKK
jgi:tRNA threonylcarbamoyladenosine biosynthesis protein TsaB